MLQEICENGKKNRNKDAAMPMIPVMFMILAYSIFAKVGLQPPWSIIAYALAFAVMAVVYYLVYRYYLSAFRYSLVYEPLASGEVDAFGDPLSYPYPVGTIVFERLAGKGSRLYETVRTSELREVVAPGQPPSFEVSSRCVNAAYTPRTKKNAYTLYYERNGRLHRTYFHPTEQFITRLRLLL